MPNTSDNGDMLYLRHCLPGSEDLCDLIVVAGQKRFPVHSQYLACHSQFIKQLILETGPFSWQHPLIIDQVLHEHSSACVHALLNGVYNLGSLFIDSPDLAWQLSKLTDQLNCPKMLRSCRDYLNQMPLCQPDDALHWLTVTAHEAELDDLHANCASKIAADFDRVAKDIRLAIAAAAAAGDAVIAPVGGVQGEQSSSKESESDEDSSSEDNSLPVPQVVVGNKAGCEEASSSEEESSSEDESKPGPQAATAADDSSSEEESSDDESSDGE
ncbi:hypothetical protein WJX77_000809 [Trebouxia sp. C0004]